MVGPKVVISKNLAISLLVLLVMCSFVFDRMIYVDDDDNNGGSSIVHSFIELELLQSILLMGAAYGPGLLSHILPLYDLAQGINATPLATLRLLVDFCMKMPQYVEVFATGNV